MTARTVHVLTDAPAVLVTYTSEFSWSEHGTGYDDVIEIEDHLPYPHYLILDVTEMHINMGELIEATNAATRQDRSFIKHHNVAGLVVVTNSKVMEMVTRGVRNAAFGNLNVLAFATVDEAKDYVRQVTS